MKLRFVISITILCCILLVSLIYNFVINQREAAKENSRLKVLQIEYNKIYEAREQVKDYYSDLYYIRNDITDCLKERGVPIHEGDGNLVPKKEFDSCTTLVHSIRNIPNIPELEKIAVKPYPAEIEGYDEYLEKY